MPSEQVKLLHSEDLHEWLTMAYESLRAMYLEDIERANTNESLQEIRVKVIVLTDIIGELRAKVDG